MNTRHSIRSALLLAALLTAAGELQAQGSGLKLNKVSGTPNHHRIDAHGNLLPGGAAEGATLCFDNTDSSGFFSVVADTNDNEWMDWAVKSCGGSDIVGFSFGYSSNSVATTLGGPGAAMEFIFHEGATGFGSFGTVVASFDFTGLPVGTNIIDVDLSAGGNFNLPDGAFGFGFHFTQAFNTGPILVFAGDGLGGPDSNGDYDAFDWYSPLPASTATYLGTFFFGGPPYDFSSWYLTLEAGDIVCPPASATLRNDSGNTNPNVFTATAPEVGGVWQATITHPTATQATVVAFFGPGIEVNTGVGVLLVNVTDPAGEILSIIPKPLANGVARFQKFGPNDISLCGATASAQGVIFDSGFRLTNAVDMVVGL